MELKPSIKPCPFCGGEAAVHIDLAVPKTANGRIRVGCDTLGCRGFYHASCKYYELRDEAVESWNTRVEGISQAVVRCKDCRHYIDHAWVIYTDVEHICTFWNSSGGVKVEPEGFCKWGVARDA